MTATDGSRSTTAGSGSRLDPDELVILEEEREFLLASLADLEREHDAGDLDEVDYATLRDDYTSRAAEVLRAIDEQREAFQSARRPLRPARLVMGGAIVVVLAVLAGLWVASSSGTRKAGQTATGSLGNGAGADNNAATASSSVAPTTTSPSSKCIGEITGSPLNALKCFDKVLGTSPNDAMALTYRGWTLALTAQSTSNPQQATPLVQGALANLTKAEQINPSLPDTHVFLGIVYLNLHRCDDARAELAKLDALSLPSNSPILQLVNSRLRPQLANGACPGS